jgi:hypothetical protein
VRASAQHGVVGPARSRLPLSKAGRACPVSNAATTTELRRTEISKNIGPSESDGPDCGGIVAIASLRAMSYLSQKPGSYVYVRILRRPATDENCGVTRPHLNGLHW